MGKGISTMEVGSDGVALITIVNPPVNALSYDVLISLREHYEQAMKREDVFAIVLTGANGRFCGGFDINAFHSGTGAKEKLGITPNEFLSYYIEGAKKKPSVAAIDGLALGGGLEIAMACHARISTPNAQLALPELQLGIIPGMGGTQRLPRLVGLPKALEMMLQSKSIKGKEAESLGLIDSYTASQDLISAARSLALQISEFKKPWIKTLYRTDRLPSVKDARAILNLARTELQKGQGNLEHFSACFEVVETGVVLGPQAGLVKEGYYAKKLQDSETSKSLMHFFFAQRATSKVPGITDKGLVPNKIKKVGVVSSGTIGSEIATVFVLNNFRVILKDQNEKSLQSGLAKVRENLQSYVKKGKITQEEFEKRISLLTVVFNYEQFGDLDIVIEACPEDLSLKQNIFCDLEKYCSSKCIIATNNSTIDLNLIGQMTNSQDRIIGANFFSSAKLISLLEIIRTPKTPPQVLLDLLHLAKHLQKTPIIVRNCIVNRMILAYAHAALFLVDFGADLYMVDRVLTKFGMQMGPFRFIDQVVFNASISTGTKYRSTLISSMLQDKKTGFYLYDEKREASQDLDIIKYVEKSRRNSGFTPDNKMAKLMEKDIIEMILFPVINEAYKILKEGICIKSSDLDVASVLGFGFPSYRGGIMFWADLLGAKNVYKRLEVWSTKYGEIFKPCDYLAKRASKELSLGAQFEAKSRL
ncbi:hypothetical protein LUZ60_005087 [Juncus effusus]|nr:hypothetical protein LUZ60_005087 [Juncus effusus]